jgi:SAM-dependent methyltransferase
VGAAFIFHPERMLSAMNITQTFYDNMAAQYDKLFQDWHAATREQALLLDGLFQKAGFAKTARLLDCACGIGTQAIGLAGIGYSVTASDISLGELAEAKKRAEAHQVALRFEQADFCALSEVFAEPFDIIICMDNALPHMLTAAELQKAVDSIMGQLAAGGIFVASIRDYDALLETRPPYSPPYIHQTEKGQRVAFQTWRWEGDIYRLTQYMIEDEETLQTSKFECCYRATRREELTGLLLAAGCSHVQWLMPEESGFYQPIVVAGKK